MGRLLLSWLLGVIVAVQPAISREQAVEVGTVQWQRDFQAALLQSKASGRPVFLLFQEVPGCIGCQTFGREVLSHPLVVEAVEEHFIPVLVYNNRSGGMDEKLLQRYDEPSWNFQVIRFLDSEGVDIIERRDRIWSVGETVARMIMALEAAARPVPGYLRNLQIETEYENLARIVFSMACFWTGEYQLGGIDGVVDTEAGWYKGQEVTRVVYNSRIIDRSSLIAEVANRQCARAVYLEPGETLDSHGLEVGLWQESLYRQAPRGDQKKQLQQAPQVEALPGMTPMQRTKINSMLPDDPQAALDLLSPRQRQNIRRGQ